MQEKIWCGSLVAKSGFAGTTISRGDLGGKYDYSALYCIGVFIRIYSALPITLPRPHMLYSYPRGWLGSVAAGAVPVAPTEQARTTQADEADAILDLARALRLFFRACVHIHLFQFIFVTHNKISMEKSKHLFGVTMQEPGVSRLVSVDVDEAMKMAAV